MKKGIFLYPRIKITTLTSYMLTMLVVIFAIQMGSSFTNAQESYPVIFEATDRAVLSAARAGILYGLDVNVGSSVKKGTVIATVDTTELELQRKRSQLMLNYLDVQVNDLSKLTQRGLATNESLAKATMEREVTRTDLEIQKALINKSYIRVPFDCVVVRRLVEPHEWVTEGKPVVEVLQPGKLRAVANIPSGLAVTINKATPQPILVHDLKITVTGKFVAIAPEVDELSNTAKVIWSIEKAPPELLSGMKGEVQIERKQ